MAMLAAPRNKKWDLPGLKPSLGDEEQLGADILAGVAWYLSLRVGQQEVTTTGESAAPLPASNTQPVASGKFQLEKLISNTDDLFKQPHKKGCPCCVGVPDTAFEDAIDDICALGIEGITTAIATKFVRLCTNDRATMRLSKKKAKIASKLRKPLLSVEEIAQMQQVVLRMYGKIPTYA